MDETYRLGWVIPGCVAGLTHYTSQVTMDEYQAISASAMQLVDVAQREFHIVIDNRRIDPQVIMNLSEIKQAAPYMNHALLRWVVVVAPLALADAAPEVVTQQDGHTRMRVVATIEEALAHLGSVDTTLDWEQAERGFFPT